MILATSPFSSLFPIPLSLSHFLALSNASYSRLCGAYIGRTAFNTSAITVIAIIVVVITVVATALITTVIATIDYYSYLLLH
jgi:hypothetical protein